MHAVKSGVGRELACGKVVYKHWLQQTCSLGILTTCRCLHQCLHRSMHMYVRTYVHFMCGTVNTVSTFAMLLLHNREG